MNLLLLYLTHELSEEVIMRNVKGTNWEGVKGSSGNIDGSVSKTVPTTVTNGFQISEA